eukprot:995865-Prymnesium_polylepis.1
MSGAARFPSIMGRQLRRNPVVRLEPRGRFFGTLDPALSTAGGAGTSGSRVLLLLRELGAR